MTPSKLFPALFGLVLIAGCAALDAALTARGIALPVYYLLPILALALFADWSLVLAATLLSAVAHVAIDLAFAANFTSPLAVHLFGLVFFVLSLGLARAAYILRLMLDYSVRGETWRINVRPRRVGERLVIVPSWLRQTFTNDPRQASARPTDVPVYVDRSKAFGSGTHPTTQMCLALVEKYVRPGDRVFDLGCGSGILSLAAVKLGAASALGLDVNPEAVRVATQNALFNDVADRIEIRKGSLDSVLPPDGSAPPQFEFVVANILAHVIVDVLNQGLARTVAPGGALLLSGIRDDESAGVFAAIKAAGLAIVEEQRSGEWWALVTRPPAP